MPNYSKHGKIQVPIEPEVWASAMKQYQSPTRSYISTQNSLAFLSIIYYFGIRCSEALKLTSQDFTIERSELTLDVGPRLKHSHRTPPLTIRKDLPFVDCIINELQNPPLKNKEMLKVKFEVNTKMLDEGKVVIGQPYLFSFTRMTGYNIVNRVFPSYPHFFRLSRITQLLQDGWTIPEVQSWTGLTLNALNYYVGLATIRKKGKTIR